MLLRVGEIQDHCKIFERNLLESFILNCPVIQILPFGAQS